MGGGLVPEERVEALAVLARDGDERIAERAANALLSQPLETFVAAVAHPDVALALLEYCANDLQARPGVADALAGNPNCPPKLLALVAARFSTATVQALTENLARLSDYPPLVEALLECPNLTTEQKKTLEDLLKEDVDEAALKEALEAAESDKQKRETLLQRLARMKVVDRIKLALIGGQSERMALIRDPNKLVQRSVLQSPRLTDREVEGFAAMASLSDEILRLIAGNRNFIKNYIVVKNLVNNPKVPLDLSLHLLPRLIPNDLKFLTMNKNVPETLRTTALKLQRQRAQAKKGLE